MEQAVNSGDKSEEATTRDEDEDVLETWAPEGITVKVFRIGLEDWAKAIGCVLIPGAATLIAWGMAQVLLLLAPIFVLFCVGIWLRSGYWTMVVRNTSYQLTRSTIRLRCGSEMRELRLSELTETAILPVHGHRGIGHIVLHEQRTRRRSPAIPWERPLADKSPAIPVERPSLPQEDSDAPWPQVHKGAMTFWLVANPEMVCERILRAARGINPNACGPYR